MSGLDQIKAALALKKGVTTPGHKRAPAIAPNPLPFITQSCTRVAQDGKPYTITYPN